MVGGISQDIVREAVSFIPAALHSLRLYTGLQRPTLNLIARRPRATTPNTIVQSHRTCNLDAMSGDAYLSLTTGILA